MSVEDLKASIVIEDGDLPFTTLDQRLQAIPEGHVAVVDNRTGDVIDAGRVDDAIAQVLMEEDQIMDRETGVSHKVKYDTLYNMINSEPALNQALSLRSELPVAYGYMFQYVQIPDEFDESAKRPVPKISIPYWNLWASYVNLDHVIRQTIHSLLATGNVWIEKMYDNAGMNKRGWGVKSMRVLSPDAMYNVIDERGRIIEFVQWAGDTTRRFGDDINITKRRLADIQRDIERQRKESDRKRHTPDIVRIPRHKVVYMNYNAYYDDTVYGFGAAVPLISYARSKVGIQKRVLRMIENSTTSFVVFKYGTEKFTISGSTAKKIFKNVKSKQHLKYVLLPYYFEPQEVELGGKMQNVEPYLNYFRDEQLYGAGLPPFLSGRGGTSEGAENQMEILVRQFKYIQNVLGHEYRRQLFAECVVGDPSNSRMITTTPAQDYPYMTVSTFLHVPMLNWRTIEKVSDQRLRHEAYATHGILSVSEIRRELGYTEELDEDDLPAPIKVEREKIEQADRVVDKDREIGKEQNEVAREQVEVAKITARNPTNGPSTSDA